MMMMLTTASKSTKSSLFKSSVQFGTKSQYAALQVRSYCSMVAQQDQVAMHQRRYGLQAMHVKNSMVLGNTPIRGFFGSKKKEPTAEEKKAAEDKKKEEEATKEEASEKAEAEAKDDKEASAEESKEGEEKKEDSSTSSSSDEEKEPSLTEKDVQRIKKLFNEQETEIKALEKQIEELKSQSTRKDKEVTLARIEFTKQVKENEQTVQRYRKMIEDEKEFAITKFAKDLLEVRDAVRLALEHTDMEAIKANEDIVDVKEKFVGNMEGQQMTADVMDKVLERFKVVQYDPKGEKFDPTLHEAVFTVAQSENDNDTVEIVMQTGWKIGERILRAAKVGIVKK